MNSTDEKKRIENYPFISQRLVFLDLKNTFCILKVNTKKTLYEIGVLRTAFSFIKLNLIQNLEFLNIFLHKYQLMVNSRFLSQLTLALFFHFSLFDKIRHKNLIKIIHFFNIKKLYVNL